MSTESDSFTVTFTNSGTGISMIPKTPLNLKFQPDTVIVKQVTMVTPSVSNGIIYYLWCSLTQSHIATLFVINGFITIEPLTTFSITNPQEISFRMEYASPNYPMVRASGLAVSWSITMEFSRGKKAEYFISKE